MRPLGVMVMAAACGAGDAPPAIVAPVAPVVRAPRCAPSVPDAACVAAAGLRTCAIGDRDRVGEWRFALVGSAFEATQDVTSAELAAAWQSGRVAASAETQRALAGVLGAGAALLPANEAPTESRWAVVPAHELSPAWSVITVGGEHPLARETGGVLVVPLCGAASAPVRNIDPERVTTLVMSGTTAMTGRTGERIDDTGIASTVRYIKPFFASADLVHISNEVAFVRDCNPRAGQKQLVFCSRDSYIGLLEALHAKLIELTGSHLVDYGHRSLVRTIDMYAKHGWIWFGGGRTQIDGTEPRFVEDHGNRLAFVGCNAVNWWVKAISQGPGTANCDWPRMVWQIQDLRRRGFTPIATVQHRELRTHAPPPDLVHDLRKLAEAGAVFVLGSQAHVAHPWDVHFGAYVHYGPGNILFAQYREEQREATVDKLYIYAGRLMTVAHLFVRTEHGQPRMLTDRERAQFLDQLAVAAASIDPPDPTAHPVAPTETRARPDSVVVHGRSQRLAITVPVGFASETPARYRLVVDMDGSAPTTEDAFVVAPAGKRIATRGEIESFMRAKYPIAR